MDITQTITEMSRGLGGIDLSPKKKQRILEKGFSRPIGLQDFNEMFLKKHESLFN